MLYNLTLSTVVLSLQSYSTLFYNRTLQCSTIVLYNCTLVLYSTIVLYNSKVIYNLCMYGMGRPGRNMSVADIHIRKFLWVYCPGHAGVKGNDRGDRLVDKATLTSGLLLGRSEVLRSLRHYLWAQSQGHDTWREALKKKALDDHPRKDERGPSSVRRTMEPFQRQRLENFRETGIAHMGFSECIDIILN